MLDRDEALDPFWTEPAPALPAREAPPAEPVSVSLASAVLSGRLLGPIRDALADGATWGSDITAAVEGMVDMPPLPVAQAVRDLLPLVATCSESMPRQREDGSLDRSWSFKDLDGELIRRIRDYRAADEEFCFSLETPAHGEAYDALDLVAKRLASVLKTFVDRHDRKWAVRFEGVIYTAPGAGRGGYGDEHVCWFDPADLEGGVVDLACEGGPKAD